MTLDNKNVRRGLRELQLSQTRMNHIVPDDPARAPALIQAAQETIGAVQ